MKKNLISLWIFTNVLRTLPIYFVYSLLSKETKTIIKYDLLRWNELVLKSEEKNPLIVMHYLVLNYKEYRNLIYFRIKKEKFLSAKILEIFYPPLKSLFLNVPEIGKGFVIFHGFSSIIYCKSIGENCSIGQQVTVGMTTDYPTIENNVLITAGAVVIGGITIHSNSIVGANATVTKSVPENCVVVGNPAYIVRRNGKKTKENLI